MQTTHTHVLSLVRTQTKKERRGCEANTYVLCSLAKADLFPAEIGLDQSVYQICSAATYVAAMQSSDNAIH